MDTGGVRKDRCRGTLKLGAAFVGALAPTVLAEKKSHLDECGMIFSPGEPPVRKPAGGAGRGIDARSSLLVPLGGFQNTKLGQRGDAVVEPDFLRDLAALHAKHGRSREVHLPTGCRR